MSSAADHAELKKLLSELGDVDATIRAAAKQTVNVRKRRSTLKKEIMELMTKLELDEITDRESGIMIKRSVREKPVPLSHDHIVRAVSDVLGTAEQDGQRVAAAADRARENMASVSLSLKRVKAEAAETEED